MGGGWDNRLADRREPGSDAWLVGSDDRRAAGSNARLADRRAAGSDARLAGWGAVAVFLPVLCPPRLVAVVGDFGRVVPALSWYWSVTEWMLQALKFHNFCFQIASDTHLDVCFDNVNFYFYHALGLVTCVSHAQWHVLLFCATCLLLT
jgi:hypothetical protein